MEKGFSLVRNEEEEEKRNEKSEETSYSSMAMMKKVSSMSVPMVAVTVSKYLIQFISVVMAGHLGPISLASIAIATSLTNVTGFSLLSGLSGALDTLCGQAFGAEQFRKMGSYTYSSMLCLLISCIPISLLWIFLDKLLELFHQDPLISQLACRYAMLLIPALFAHSIIQSLSRYFMSQGLIRPLLLSSFGALCFHIPFCWLLVYKLGLGVVGAALSISVSYWLYVGFLCIFTRNTSLRHETSDLKLKEFLWSIKQFIALAIPSAMMTCLEWWSFELLILVSGFLPNSKLETSIMSICLTTSCLHYVLVRAIGASASTYVSNELGAGNPRAARAAAYAAIFLGGVDATIVTITLYSYRKKWAYIYTNATEVIDYAEQITLVLCLSIGVDSFLAVLSGVARGTGWQKLGGYTSLGSYYLVGIPVGLILCFVAKLRGKGLWIGVLTGSTLQFLVLAFVTSVTDWEQEVTKARNRVLQMTQQGNQETESILKEDEQVAQNV